MQDCISSRTPIKIAKTRSDCRQHNKDSYQYLIETLMNLAISTRLNIVYTVNFFSRFNSNHWKTAETNTALLERNYFNSSSPLYGVTYRQMNKPMFIVADDE